MRISLRWLKQYLPLDLTLTQVCDTLTMLGLEVESVLDLGYQSKQLVVCEILDIRPHPNADKLVICTIMADEPKPVEVVCGAKNMKIGDRVVLAKVGAVLPPSSVHKDGLTLKAAKIRGVESCGMLCSGPEMTFNDDASGLMILPPETPVAEPFDALIEIKVTPNRPDCLSIIGTARELAAATKRKLSVPLPQLVESTVKAETAARVIVKAKDACPRYTARVIKGVTIGPSPLWLQRAVESAGMRSINNIVDVTNYVLVEMGHPLHAFDLDKIDQRTVVVRMAEEGEKMKTLDGMDAELQATDLLIADAKRPIALAGIMGGLESEISDSTTNVLLESAYFNPTTIRRTRKRLDKNTEASYRFERGTDAKRLVLALDRATELIHQVAGGEILKGVLDVMGQIPEPKPVWLRIERMNQSLGVSLSGREIADMLVTLGFEIIRTDGERLQVGIPSHRVDVTREADVFEEVARLLGYDKIPATLPRTISRPEPFNALRRARTEITDFLVGAGFHQTILYSFTSKENLKAFGAPTNGLIHVLNPLTVDQSVMRTSMIPGIVAAVKRNHNFGSLDVRLFEIGKTYAPPPPPVEKTDEEKEAEKAAENGNGEAKAAEDGTARKARVPADLPPAPVETTWLVAALTGGGKVGWNVAAHEVDFYDVKGLAETLLDSMGIRRGEIEEARDVAWLHPSRGAAYSVQGQRVCVFGELAPALAEKSDLRRRLYLLEINLSALIGSARQEKSFRGLPKYPAVERDLALLVDRGVRALDLERTMRQADRELLTGLRLFDLYEGDKVPPGKRSLAYGLTFRSPERTLTEEEVNAAIDRILKALESKHGAELRSA